MFKFLRKHRTVVFVGLAVVLLALPFFGIGTNFFISSQDVIFKVNGEKVRLGRFNRIFNRNLRQQGEVSKDQRLQIMNQSLSELIRTVVFHQEAKKYGIHVSDQELQGFLASIPAFQTEGQFDPQKYGQTVYQLTGSSVKDFEHERKIDLYGNKLNQLIASSVHITDDQLNHALQQRLAIETDKEAKKELKENPEKLRQELRNQQINMVFADYLNQINTTLRVKFVSETFQKELQGQS